MQTLALQLFALTHWPFWRYACPALILGEAKIIATSDIVVTIQYFEIWFNDILIPLFLHNISYNQTPYCFYNWQFSCIISFLLFERRIAEFVLM